MKRILACFLAATGSLALAADRLPIQHVRFSADGSRVMVLSSGVLDGSGFGTANLQVLNTSTGASLWRSRRTSESEVPNANVLRWQVLNTPPVPGWLRSAGLWPGVTSAARYNRSYPQLYPQWTDALPAGQQQVTPVKLWTVPVPIKLEVYALPSTCAYLDLVAPDQPAGFRLTVNRQVVFEDQDLPDSRTCTTRYTLERVDVRGNRALLTVRGYGPGFEGPDAHPIFIATTLK